MLGLGLEPPCPPALKAAQGEAWMEHGQLFPRIPCWAWKWGIEPKVTCIQKSF